MPISTHSDLFETQGFRDLNPDLQLAAIQGFTNKAFQSTEIQDEASDPELISGIFREEARAKARVLGIRPEVADAHFGKGVEFSLNGGANEVEKGYLQILQDERLSKAEQLSFKPAIETEGRGSLDAALGSGQAERGNLIPDILSLGGYRPPASVSLRKKTSDPRDTTFEVGLGVKGAKSPELRVDVDIPQGSTEEDIQKIIINTARDRADELETKGLSRELDASLGKDVGFIGASLQTVGRTLGSQISGLAKFAQSAGADDDITKFIGDAADIATANIPFSSAETQSKVQSGVQTVVGALTQLATGFAAGGLAGFGAKAAGAGKGLTTAANFSGFALSQTISEVGNIYADALESHGDETKARLEAYTSGVAIFAFELAAAKVFKGASQTSSRLKGALLGAGGEVTTENLQTLSQILAEQGIRGEDAVKREIDLLGRAFRGETQAFRQSQFIQATIGGAGAGGIAGAAISQGVKNQENIANQVAKAASTSLGEAAKARGQAAIKGEQQETQSTEKAPEGFTEQSDGSFTKEFKSKEEADKFVKENDANLKNSTIVEKDGKVVVNITPTAESQQQAEKVDRTQEVVDLANKPPEKFKAKKHEAAFNARKDKVNAAAKVLADPNSSEDAKLVAQDVIDVTEKYFIKNKRLKPVEQQTQQEKVFTLQDTVEVATEDSAFVKKGDEFNNPDKITSKLRAGDKIESSQPNEKTRTLTFDGNQFIDENGNSNGIIGLLAAKGSQIKVITQTQKNNEQNESQQEQQPPSQQDTSGLPGQRGIGEPSSKQAAGQTLPQGREDSVHEVAEERVPPPPSDIERAFEVSEGAREASVVAEEIQLTEQAIEDAENANDVDKAEDARNRLSNLILEENAARAREAAIAVPDQILSDLEGIYKQIADNNLRAEEGEVTPQESQIANANLLNKADTLNRRLQQATGEIKVGLAKQEATKFADTIAAQLPDYTPGQLEIVLPEIEQAIQQALPTASKPNTTVNQVVEQVSKTLKDKLGDAWESIKDKIYDIVLKVIRKIGAIQFAVDPNEGQSQSTETTTDLLIDPSEDIGKDPSNIKRIIPLDIKDTTSPKEFREKLAETIDFRELDAFKGSSHLEFNQAAPDLTSPMILNGAAQFRRYEMLLPPGWKKVHPEPFQSGWVMIASPKGVPFFAQDMLRGEDIKDVIEGNGKIGYFSKEPGSHNWAKDILIAPVMGGLKGKLSLGDLLGGAFSASNEDLNEVGLERSDQSKIGEKAKRISSFDDLNDSQSTETRINPLEGIGGSTFSGAIGDRNQGSFESNVMADSMRLQRGAPELYASIIINSHPATKEVFKDTTGIRSNIYEHIGDLYHRAGSPWDMGAMLTKVKTNQQNFGGSFRMPLDEDVEGQRRSNESFHAQEEGREENQSRSKALTEIGDLTYAAMYSRLQAFTPLQAAGRNMAIAFGLGKYASYDRLGNSITRFFNAINSSDLDSIKDNLHLIGFSEKGVHNIEGRTNNDVNTQWENNKKIYEKAVEDPHGVLNSIRRIKSIRGLADVASDLDKISESIENGTFTPPQIQSTDSNIGLRIESPDAFETQSSVEFASKNTIPGEKPFRITHLNKKGEPIRHEQFDSLEKANAVLRERHETRIKKGKKSIISDSNSTRLYGGIPFADPQAIIDTAKSLYSVAKDLADFTSRLVKAFGEKARAIAKNLWEDLKATAGDLTIKFLENKGVLFFVTDPNQNTPESSAAADKGFEENPNLEQVTETVRAVPKAEKPNVDIPEIPPTAEEINNVGNSVIPKVIPDADSNAGFNTVSGLERLIPKKLTIPGASLGNRKVWADNEQASWIMQLYGELNLAVPAIRAAFKNQLDNLITIGRDKKKDRDNVGRVLNLIPGRAVSITDVLETWDGSSTLREGDEEFQLTEDKVEELTILRGLSEMIKDYARENGVEADLSKLLIKKNKTLNENYFPRGRVKELIDPDTGKKIKGENNIQKALTKIYGKTQSYQKERRFKTQSEGQQAGFVYTSPSHALSDFLADIHTAIYINRLHSKFPKGDNKKRYTWLESRQFYNPSSDPGVVSTRSSQPIFAGIDYVTPEARAAISKLFTNNDPPTLIKGFRSVADVQKGLRATFDVSSIGNQMLNGILVNLSKGNARGALLPAWGAIAAVFNPEYTNRLIHSTENQQALREMAEQGTFTLREKIDQIAGLGDDGLISKIEDGLRNNIPLLGPVVSNISQSLRHRFNTAFAGSVELMAIELWKTYSKVGDGFVEKQQVMQMIENMLGIANLTRLGISDSQKALEATLLFSSQMQRGIGNLYVSAVTGTPAAKKVARDALARTWGMKAVMLIALQALLKRNGLSDDDEEDAMQRINPLHKEYMRLAYKTDPDGLTYMATLGGSHDSMVRGAVNISKAFFNKDDGSFEDGFNQSIRFFRSKASPSMSTIWDFTSKETFLGKKLSENPVQRLKQVSQTAWMPLSIEQAFEEDNFTKGNLDKATEATLGALGISTFVVNPRQLENKEAEKAARQLGFSQLKDAPILTKARLQEETRDKSKQRQMLKVPDDVSIEEFLDEEFQENTRGSNFGIKYLQKNNEFFARNAPKDLVDEIKSYVNEANQRIFNLPSFTNKHKIVINGKTIDYILDDKDSEEFRRIFTEESSKALQGLFAADGWKRASGEIKKKAYSRVIGVARNKTRIKMGLKPLR